MKEVHQIWLGDSREMCQKFKPDTIQSIITDPPFGIDNLSNMAVTQQGKAMARKIANDESPQQAIKIFNEVMDVVVPKMKRNSDIYVFTAYQVLKEWLQVADDLGKRHGFTRKAVLVWEKEGPGMGDLDSLGQGHEFIIYLKRGDRVNTAKRRNGVLHFAQLRPSQLIHPHEKPTALLEQLLKQSTDRGDFVVDPFGGSGSLVRAARACGRNAVGIELNQLNYELATKKLLEGDSGFEFE